MPQHFSFHFLFKYTEASVHIKNYDDHGNDDDDHHEKQQHVNCEWRSTNNIYI